MRLALLCIALFAATAPALARDPTLQDGRFTICAFQDFAKCQLLTARTARRYEITDDEKRVMKDLKRHVAAGRASIAALEKSFGKSSKTFSHSTPNDNTIAWYEHSVGMNDLNAKCPECGIYVSSIGNRLTSINYIVDQKFTVVWNRFSLGK